MNNKLIEYLDTRIKLLNKVKEIITLPNTDYVTVEMASAYYEVCVKDIDSIINNNKEDLSQYGLRLFEHREIMDMVGAESNNIKISNNGELLITKRALFEIGMLLENSVIAKELRSKLLDIVHDAETTTEIVSSVVNEIKTEREISEEITKAILSGDSIKFERLFIELEKLRAKRGF